jgi:glutamine synthetase
VTLAADQIQLYKLIARQVAANMGMTATFLPKPMMGINGSGMHTNLSLSRLGRNSFYDAKDANQISAIGYDFIDRILASATDLSLILNPSVNAYRRLDPHYEAPNQIKFSAVDRTSMIRLPLGNEKTARIEVRSVAPDANPYLLFYSLVQTGLTGPNQDVDESKRPRTRTLPGNIYDAIRSFKSSDFISQLLGEEVRTKYSDLKLESAEMCPKALGTRVKRAEVIYHHEVANQMLRNQF